MTTHSILYCKTKRLFNSPFVLALIGGVIISLADLVWLFGELSTHFELISSFTYLIIRFCVGISIFIGLVFCTLAAVRYVQNGYVQQDNHIELCHKLNSVRSKRLHTIR